VDATLGLFLDKLHTAYEKRGDMDSAYFVGLVLEEPENISYEELDELIENITDTPPPWERYSFREMIEAILDWKAMGHLPLIKVLGITGRHGKEIDACIYWLEQLRQIKGEGDF